MYEFKKIILEKNCKFPTGASLLEISAKIDKQELQNCLTQGFKGVKRLPEKAIRELIDLTTKYDHLLFDDATICPESLEKRRIRTALRLFEIIFGTDGNFWIIKDKKGEIAGYFYIYYTISLVVPELINKETKEINYTKKPYTTTLAGCLKKDFWGIESKKIMKKILDMLFVKENIKKIKCEIFSSNPYVKGILRTFGFRREGILKNETINRGKPESVEIWALFKSEFEILQKT